MQEMKNSAASSGGLKKTPLHDCHIALRARMVDFGGWDMPVQYSGVIAEHMAVRAQAGLFDVSHMGEIFISGNEARAFLNRVTTNDVTKLYDGRCQYTLLCYDNGTVVDDLIVSQIDANNFIAIVNAANSQKDFDWLVKNNHEGVTLSNQSDNWGLIAIQGPASKKIVSKIFGRDFLAPKYYHFQKIQHDGVALYLFCTGYTGEDGFELMVPGDAAVTYWNQFLEAGREFGMVPVGLGARDTLRLEAAYPLYGHEISDQINPLEVGLDWVVKLGKKDFIGEQALAKAKEQGLKRELVGFEMTEPGIARDRCTVYDTNGIKIGHVTSGTYSPTLKKAIGLALINKTKVVLDAEIFIDIRGNNKRAKIVKTPFYRKNSVARIQ